MTRFSWAAKTKFGTAIFIAWFSVGVSELTLLGYWISGIAPLTGAAAWTWTMLGTFFVAFPVTWLLLPEEGFYRTTKLTPAATVLLGDPPAPDGPTEMYAKIHNGVLDQVILSLILARAEQLREADIKEDEDAPGSAEMHRLTADTLPWVIARVRKLRIT